jgi:hypothetical protein
MSEWRCECADGIAGVRERLLAGKKTAGLTDIVTGRTLSHLDVLYALGSEVRVPKCGKASLHKPVKCDN